MDDHPFDAFKDRWVGDEIVCDDFQYGYLSLLEDLLSSGVLVGKFKTIYNLRLKLTNPHKSLIAVKKNWNWCFLEGIDRFSWEIPSLMNPGTAYHHRSNWKKKLEKEGGLFDYSYGTAYQSQVKNLINQLKPANRDLIVSVWKPEYLTEKKEYNRVPCTLFHQFIVREEGTTQSLKIKYLDMYTSMRTLDAMNLMPYDVFHHTMLQRYMATEAGLALGNFHLYCPMVYYQKKRDITGSVKSTIIRLQQTKLDYGTDWKFSEIDRKVLVYFQEQTQTGESLSKSWFDNHSTLQNYWGTYETMMTHHYHNFPLGAGHSLKEMTPWGKNYYNALWIIKFNLGTLLNEFNILSLKLLKVNKDEIFRSKD